MYIDYRFTRPDSTVYLLFDHMLQDFLQEVAQQ